MQITVVQSVHMDSLFFAMTLNRNNKKEVTNQIVFLRDYVLKALNLKKIDFCDFSLFPAGNVEGVD